MSTTVIEIAFKQYLEKLGHAGMPWEASVDALRAAFAAGYESATPKYTPIIGDGSAVWHYDPYKTWTVPTEPLEPPYSWGATAGSSYSTSLGGAVALTADDLAAARSALMKTATAVIAAAPDVPSVADIYAAWPVKKARGAAIKAIEKALKKVSDTDLLEAVNAYAAAVKTWRPEDMKYVPMCSTWMNQERWTDDRSTWSRGGVAPVSQFSKTTQ